jgi:hypothetical protein
MHFEVPHTHYILWYGTAQRAEEYICQCKTSSSCSATLEIPCFNGIWSLLSGAQRSPTGLYPEPKSGQKWLVWSILLLYYKGSKWHTHTHITNTLLHDCTNGRMMSQTERGCMQNKKGTVTLARGTKGSPILSKSHLKPTAECVQWSVPLWSFQVLNHAAKVCHDASENIPSPSSEWQNLKTRKAWSSKPSEHAFTMRCGN